MNENTKDRRVAPTITLWLVTMLMFIVATMPLVQSVEQGNAVGLVSEGEVLILVFALLPVLVLITAASGTYAIWRFGKPETASLPTSEMKQFQDRLANLETIVSFDDKALRTKIDRLRSENKS